ncbi:hypothetical protein M2347_002579 [Chryseobacterium sp. H1D6B]|uniref:hypothetical protein n=1 Tax=Chryseobacterium sp. H1D6B TaxID=2940588 RepID=UPI0015CB79EA|nr:hypothetical protein [Chryseobacterium sp. H1D6B]MDH6252852.1 hypothetical protein [Chryseobacterium sp. H1D6B]
MKIYTLLLLSFLLLSCDFKTFRENDPQDKLDAEKVTEKFYTLIKQDKKQEVFKLFSSEFFKVTKKSDLDQLIDWAIKESKTSSTHTLTDCQTNVEKGTNAKSEYILSYSVQRGTIKTDEGFTLKKEKDDKIRIVGYKINAELPK